MSPRMLSDILGPGSGGRDDVALVIDDEGRDISYGELLDDARRTATGLYEVGLRRGDTIATWIPNCSAWISLQVAASRLGLTVLALNPRYGLQEVGHLLELTRARAILITPNFLTSDYEATLRSVLSTASLCHLTHVITTSMPIVNDFGGREHVLFEDLGVGPEAEDHEPTGQLDDILNLFGTSGTTSFPKLAMHTHGAVTRHASNAARALGLTSDDVVLGALPFCGTFGFVNLMSALAAGARVVVQPRFQPAAASAAVHRHGVTRIIGTNDMLSAMFDATEDPATLTTLRRGAIAGARDKSVVERAEKIFDVALSNVYGSSEVFALTAMRGPDEDVLARSIPGGRLISPDILVRAVDLETGAVLPDGESGELQFHGYNVTRGYLANDAANTEAFTADGWFRTKDRGSVSVRGREITFEARLADTLRLRGYLVDPMEIEELLTSHGGVARAAVVGVEPDASSIEQEAVAFVVPASGAAVSEDALIGFCSERLASFKVPSRVIVVADLPMTPSPNGEKVVKGPLRDRARTLFFHESTTEPSRDRPLRDHPASPEGAAISRDR